MLQKCVFFEKSFYSFISIFTLIFISGPEQLSSQPPSTQRAFHYTEDAKTGLPLIILASPSH